MMEEHRETIILGFVNDEDYCGEIPVTVVVTDSQLPGRGTNHAAEVDREMRELVASGWGLTELRTAPGDSFVY